jgi:hypothetical protein
MVNTTNYLIHLDNEKVRHFGNMYAYSIGKALRDDIVIRVKATNPNTAFRLGQDPKFHDALNIMDAENEEKDILDVLRAYDYCMRRLA